MNKTNTDVDRADNCTEDVPPSDIFFDNINMAEKVFVAVCGLLTLVTSIMFLDLAVFALRHYNANKHIKYKSLQILGTYPIVSLVSFLTLCIPRANLITQFLSSVYIAVSMCCFVSLMVLYYGDNQKALTHLQDSVISLRSPPCCCCCCCLPSLSVTKKNLKIIKAMVLQNAILQPALSLLSVVLWLDGRYTDGKLSVNNSYTYLNFVGAVSAVLAIYGFLVCYRLFRPHLRPAFILPKFIAFQLVIVFNRIQPPLFSTLAKYDIPDCRGILSSSVLGQAYMQMLCICELFLLSLLARHVFRRPTGHKAAPRNSDNDTVENEIIVDSDKDKLANVCAVNGIDKDAMMSHEDELHSRETNL